MCKTHIDLHTHVQLLLVRCADGMSMVKLHSAKYFSFVILLQVLERLLGLLADCLDSDVRSNTTPQHAAAIANNHGRLGTLKPFTLKTSDVILTRRSHLRHLPSNLSQWLNYILFPSKVILVNPHSLA